MSSCKRTLLVAMVMALPLGACVTEPEQTASQTDVRSLGRQLEDSQAITQLNQIPPHQLEDAVREMVATPIEFWGEVVGEQGQPIPGADVTVVVFDRLADPFQYPYFAYTQAPSVVTDRKGRFQIAKINGAGLIVSVEKEGYKSVNGASRRLAYAEALGGPPQGMAKQTPERFVFERKHAHHQLAPIATGALLLPDENGTPLHMSIREIRPYGVPPEEADAHVTCNQDAPAPDGRFAWRCALTVPGGGAQRMRLEFDRAPKDGYKETLEFGDAIDDADWDHRRWERLIIQFADGTYGYVNFRIRLTGERNVSFQGVWNPTGSPVLD